MFKYFGIVLLSIIGVALAIDEKVKLEYMNRLVADCQKSEMTSDADVDLLRKKILPDSKEAKCMVGCMFEKMTIFLNGKFSKENANKVCEAMFAGNQEGLKKAHATHQICDPIVQAGGNDKCVNGPVLYLCIQKYMPEFKLIPGA